MNLIEQAAKFVNGVDTLLEWTITGRVVVPAEAQNRANVCLSCPKHQPTGLLKRLFAGAARKHIELKNDLRLRVNGEKSLGECNVCGCVMRTKIWLELDTIKPTKEEEGNYWPQCWLLK